MGDKPLVYGRSMPTVREDIYMKFIAGMPQTDDPFDTAESGRDIMLTWLTWLGIDEHRLDELYALAVERDIELRTRGLT